QAEARHFEKSPSARPKPERPPSKRKAARTAGAMRRAPTATLSGPAPITVSIERGAGSATRPRPGPAAGTTDSEIDDLIRTLMEPSAVGLANGSSATATAHPQPQSSYPPVPSSLHPQPPVHPSPAPPASARPSTARPASAQPRSNGNGGVPVVAFSKTYARSDGKVTYVVVDDDGRPQPVQ
ncbi:MAG: hypothetical protein ACRDIA_07310, partial [Actinomycetota bacterium]